MRRFLVVACLATGCDGIFDLAPVTLGNDGGGSGDAGDGAVLPCYGGNEGGFLQICLQPGDDDPWEPVLDIETSAGADMCEQIITHEGLDLCVIAARTFDITQGVTTRGGKPLVLVATDTITITASLSASSTVNRRGPGANPVTCMPRHAPALTSAGAAGGTNGTRGGNGGAADNGAGAVATPVEPDPAMALLGGCQGGDLIGGGGGGDGGGAVYLIAGSAIVLTNALLDANGERGRAGAINGGGGGGGAGGMIVLDAPTISISSSIVVANGAGGGGGGGTTAKGTDGQATNLSLNDYGALGGTGGVLHGGNGGAGADLNSNATDGVDYAESTAGGGGGGGGHGRILLFGTNRTLSSSVFSPPLP